MFTPALTHRKMVRFDTRNAVAAAWTSEADGMVTPLRACQIALDLFGLDLERAAVGSARSAFE
jgi:hypothetical protein